MKMELNSSIYRAWKIGTLWSFIGCFIIVLIFNYQTNYQVPRFVAALGKYIPITSKSSIHQHPANITGIHLQTAANVTSVHQETANVTSIHQEPANVTSIHEPSANVTSIHQQPGNEGSKTSIHQQAANEEAKTSIHQQPANEEAKTSKSSIHQQPAKEESKKPQQAAKEESKKHQQLAKKKCNIYEGRWVYDPDQKVPLYDPTNCRIIDPSFRCRQNERPNLDYEKWRWEARDCDIPLLNGTDMLERLRNKRMVIVGDSINKNQWNSLGCILYTSISDPSRAELRAGFFHAKDYNFTLEFIWSSFLVELDKGHESGGTVLVLDKISSTANMWRGADVMLFNSWHWWSHSRTAKTWDAYEYKGHLIQEMPREKAYELAMKTWAKWMENNVDPMKSTVFFRTKSESHYGKFTCYKKTKPSTDIKNFVSHIPEKLDEVNERVIKGMRKLKVEYLNITKISQYRRDAHVSLYGDLKWKNGTVSADCSHWCLPGMPDTWNRLLYASLFFYDTSIHQQPANVNSIHQPPANEGSKTRIYQQPAKEESKKHPQPAKKCNIFEGSWVYDPNQKVPLYDTTKCQIIDQGFRCRENERPDLDFEKWRWQARDCDIPLMNGTDMLERLRNKRMVIVGDSLNKNQWNSLGCILHSSISDPSRAELRAEFFHAKDYNFTLEFIWSAFLVELDEAHESGHTVLVLDKISSSADKWRGADVMLFNSWHWWSHSRTVQTWDAYGYKGQLIKEMPREKAYELAMETWKKWMEDNVDPKKSTVFFRTKSESHYGSFWCYNSTQPSTDIKSFVSHIPENLDEVNERIIKGMRKLKVKYLNITKMSQYRRDAHPSMYSNLKWKNGIKSVDCSHWCLPGLPDTWNQLLYASLVLDASENSMSRI